MRIVSLVPSVTETLLAWGIEPVAVTRFCEQPRLRAVGGTKDPDVAAIVELAPDLVVVNDEENRREDADALTAAGLTLHVTSIRSLADVHPHLVALAAAVDADPPVPWEPPPRHRTPDARAFVPIWRRPWMSLAAGTYGSSLLEALGIDSVFADAARRYPEVSLAEAAAREPDLVVAPSEPYPFGERHRAELEAVAPVVLVDGQDLFWWGWRTPAALARPSAAAGGCPTAWPEGPAGEGGRSVPEEGGARWRGPRRSRPGAGVGRGLRLVAARARARAAPRARQGRLTSTGSPSCRRR